MEPQHESASHATDAGRLRVGESPASSPTSPLVQPVTTREQRASYQRAAEQPQQRAREAQRLALGLGWLSLGIGMAQLLAPRAAARTIGVPDQPWVTRAMGLREVVCGAGILAAERPAPWLWARVAGDALDFALLTNAARRYGAPRARLAMFSAAVAACAVLDARAALLAQEVQQRATPMRVEHSITVNRPPAEVYQFWRDFENFPRFMRHIDSITILSPRRSHWVARGPFGKVVEWDAEITIDQPNQLLAWRSVDNADVANFGTVRFIPTGNGEATILQVELHYSPPAPRVMMWLSKLFSSEPQQEVERDLQRFKQLLETGEIPTTSGQPSGRRSAFTRFLRRGAMA